jgi:hypothetical protein
MAKVSLGARMENEFLMSPRFLFVMLKCSKFRLGMVAQPCEYIQNPELYT